ncbi:carboxylate--amine ligase [Fredinandcohnia quinoae]|uniref:Carboxylate--amine ligase n=1 Tax=Fredinandcohnia quinoae TaxID=2918902 RepID=A0AAW5EB42_9BACI|nr:carboxylate--amine ligase [Fredinandcohnia sp. SECRCQ15]MCH1626890.1 carboxylate--amine ligase [Fredinandcohnia sp. SECRCQ15]
MNSKAVILGSNYYIGLSVIRCLGANNVHTVAMDYSTENTYASKSKYLKEQVIVPHYKKREAELLTFLIEYAKKQVDKPVLFPCADPYVEFIDNHLDELKKYYLINMTNQGFWSKIMDKEFLHSLAVKHGVLVPETLSSSDPNFEDQAIHEIGFPCIVKPTDSPSFVSKFRVKMFKCYNEYELKQAISKANNENLEVIVQRIIPGFDDHVYTFDAYLDQNSKVTHWLTCQKLRQYPINFGASTYTKQKYVQELYDIGAPFLESIGYKGFAEIEFKKDEKTGKFYLIEVNARTTTLNTLLEKCGMNFPLLAYNELTGKDIGSKSIKHDIGRVFIYLFEDMLSAREYVKTKQLSATQIFTSYFAKKAPAIWSFDDPAPALNFMYLLMKKVKRKLFRN